MFSVTRLILLGLALLAVVNGNYVGNTRECHEEFMGCARVASMIIGSEEGFLNSLHETTIDDLCQVGNGIRECFTDMVNNDQCTENVAWVREGLAKSSAVLDYLCVEKIDEIREHWDCLLTDPQWEDLRRCKPGPHNMPGGPGSCDISGPLACLHDVVDQDPNCKPGAKQLLDGIAYKFLSEFSDNQCNTRKAFQKALQAFMFKRK